MSRDAQLELAIPSASTPDLRAAIDARIERASLDRDAEVDASQRKRHGVVHTPAPLARFIVRSVDAALHELGRKGLGDPNVTIVDPACGPGVFLAAALAEADMERAPRIALGLDLDRRAIDRAHALLAPLAAERAWPVRLAATDTLASLDVLEPAERTGATLAVIGNPPWAGRSESRGSALSDRLLDDFRADATGAPLRERKIGVLSDAYVRFWRWACELARRSDGGAVVALVTNASFLDGPVHRGMRAAMGRWFARVAVLHLGGSALIARDGDVDENVFGVRPSVAITLAVRPRDHDERREGIVRFASLRGRRDEKLARLSETTIDALASEVVGPRWVPAPAVDPEYARWPALPALMPFHREGLQSNRDAFCIDDDRERLIARLTSFAAGEPGPWPASAGVASGHYDPERARARIRDVLERDPRAHEHVIPIAYRPLDLRWVAAIPGVCHRPRPDLLAAMRRSSVALLTVRKDRGERPWTCFGVARAIADNCYLSARSSCRTRAFPTHDPLGAPNVDRDALSAWASALDSLPTSIELVWYALAVLASPAYRERFDAALRADYPRLPPPTRPAFLPIVEAGRALGAALLDAPREPGEVSIGHHRVRDSGAIVRAIATCDAAVRPLLDEARRRS